ncbi:GTP-binding protein [Paenibacillus sp. 19GGS1-52]|uniref:CobW family GTP-binding protein n=1 Tax=Paenibacillus sp. 19GGS1-52 TaxID=2758563 RepID=UPI001EFAEC9B|nr:GTP-binding protein [Paenibacillus sp. 19GGS1-52]ULO05759.1 GTP-binding protein [Paenibacillus sp. 19GGS1-52]
MKIPVIILSGFLGSGKTTLLLTLLQESFARSLNPGVIMNELGKRDVDGYILQEHTGTNVEKLLDGCVCCSRKEELADSLSELQKRRPDAIYIELTGVADPEEIIKLLHESPLRERLSLHYSVTLLDAENALEYNSRLSADKQLIQTLRKQLSSADLIVVNKSDLVEPETLWKIEKVVRKQNKKAEIAFTHYSKINLYPVLAGIIPQAPYAPAPQRAHQDFTGAPLKRLNSDRGSIAVKEAPEKHNASYSQVSAVTLTFPQSGARLLSRERLEAFFQEWEGILLRAKGHVQLSEPEPVQLVQYSGMHTSWEDSRYPGSPYVVFIGINLNEATLIERWTALFL